MGRSLWLYKCLVKVISISLTFDMWCHLVQHHDYSLTGPEGIQSTFSRESGQSNKRSCSSYFYFFLFMEKSYTHMGFLYAMFLCYTSVHVCVKVAGRKRERVREGKMSVPQFLYLQYSLFVFHFCNQTSIHSDMSVLSLLQAIGPLTSGTVLLFTVDQLQLSANQ